jgi:hypothetical protein
LNELWPLLRPLCRRLALLGWASSAAGMAAGLTVAIASGTRLSPLMSTMQLLAGVCLLVAVPSLLAAAAVQPRPDAQHKTAQHKTTQHETALGEKEPQARDVRPEAGSEAGSEAGGEAPATVHSFLLGSWALLAGAVVFACAGLVLQNGPSAQSVAFCQVFLLGAAASGFTFLLFSKVAPPRSRN